MNNKHMQEFIEANNLSDKFKKFQEEQEFRDNWIGKEFFISGYKAPKKVKVIKVKKNITGHNEAVYELLGQAWSESFLIENVDKTTYVNNAFSTEKAAWIHYIKECKNEIACDKKSLDKSIANLVKAEEGLKNAK